MKNMSVANIVCKLSSFANYNELDYNKDDVIKVLNTFDDPTIAPGMISEIRTDGVVKQRMQFVAQNGLFFIVINSDRIDIQLTSNEKMGFPWENLGAVKEMLVDSMEKLYSIFSERAPIPYRLAWNTSYVYFEINDEEKNAYRNKFLKELDFFKDNRLDDTVIRYAGQKEASISGRDERLNVLATINSYITDPGTAIEVNGFRIDYDINTWQGNRRNRFEVGSFSEFVDTAIEIQGKLNEEFIP